MVLVRELGEHGLLQLLFQYCPASIVGDDAALLAIAPSQSLVVTTDLLVDGVHFSIGHATPNLYTTSPADAGWRAAAANLSDLAAMGASPLGITVGLGLPGDLPVDVVEGFYIGMFNCLTLYGTPIVGGDVCRSPTLTVAISALGQVEPVYAIRRSHAQPGDVIVATGVHGASRAGLELLMNPERQGDLIASEVQTLVQAHQRPRPRLDVIPDLHRAIAQTGADFRVAGMDSSDGLADAVLQICQASQVGAILDRDRLPMPDCFSDWLSTEQALDWTLYGGEDFELVLCVPESVAIALCAEQPDLFPIGHITAEREIIVRDRAQVNPDIYLSEKKRFQHFS
ncbi:MAG: thiamine-phosphate kinase [Synechococcales cyanobacterium T60_A2020_003]|nr:thiamine-phosphate kinase [Synechococcales cyanobacterium T60_A2020_003]